MDDNETYVRREVQDALRDHAEDEPLRLKIRGSEAETHWLRVDERQVRAIRELIAGGDLEAVRAILAEEN